MSAQTTASNDACYIATVRPSELVAFHLPDTRSDRLFRVDFGSSWYLSPSFPADKPGEYVMAMSRARDLRMLPHVSARGAPVFTVTLPPTNGGVYNGELGVWFETDWGRERTLIVKGIKEGSFASYFTDIMVGDSLIMIDAVPVEQLSFDEAMKYLKGRCNLHHFVPLLSSSVLLLIMDVSIRSTILQFGSMPLEKLRRQHHQFVLCHCSRQGPSQRAGCNGVTPMTAKLILRTAPSV